MNENEQMLMNIRNCRRIDLFSDPKALTPDQALQFNFMQKRRLSGEPLQYILGNTEFMGIKINVDERVLIPRPETEILAEAAIKKAKDYFLSTKLRILDLGTGSGCLAIALALFCPNVEVVAIDIARDALDAAHENARMNGIAHRIQFVHTDMCSYLEREEHVQKFDLIISNPPYIKRSAIDSLPADVQQEPKLALDGGPDGLLFYRAIIQYAGRLLKKTGTIFLELGDDQSGDIENLIAKQGTFQNLEFITDYNGIKRVAVINA